MDGDNKGWVKTDDLICPDCHQLIGWTDGLSLTCVGCGRQFPIQAGIPIIYPSHVHDITTSEVAYWDHRAEVEKANLPSSYEQDFFMLDKWNLYGYRDALAHLTRQTPILEVGCGTHPKSLFLARFSGFSEITVSDLSPAQLSVNRTFCQSIGLDQRVRHIAADLARLPFADNAFGAVFVHAALHHVPDVEQALAEMVRCLRPNGTIIVGHEPSYSMIRFVRGFAARTRLGEKQHTDDTCYSVADDELDGLRSQQIVATLSALGVEVERIDRQWFLLTFIHPLPLVISRLTGKNIKLPGRVISVTRTVDRVIARVPVVNRLSFHFSVIGVKH